MSEAPITHAIGAVIVTTAAWEKIPPSAQAEVRRIADDVFARLKTSSRQENRDAVSDIRAAGIRIVPVDDAAMRVFRDIGERSARRNVGKLYPEDLLARVRAVIADTRAKAGDTGAP
jgi:TRAP-type C4-dicarboxylate transport system substrate-binding protein